MSHNLSPERFSHLWTTERDQWFLVKGTFGYGIYALKDNNLHYLKIRTKSVYQYVIQKMLENNNKIYSMEEFIAIANSE
jgi:hypothetical protein